MINEVMPEEERVAICKNLKLALEGMETGPLDFIGFRQCVWYQREAIRTSQKRLEALR